MAEIQVSGGFAMSFGGGFQTLLSVGIDANIQLTTTGDAEARVTQQCKTTCCFEFPVILGTWEVQRVAAVEDAIHSTLEARGSKRHAPGTEWFDTTIEEVETIVKFIQPTAARL